MTARYLSLDLSTQSLKAILANEKLEPIHECVIEFDKDLPEFKTKDGVHHHSKEQNRITSPTLIVLYSQEFLDENSAMLFFRNFDAKQLGKLLLTTF